MEILKRGKFNREYTCNICECIFRYYGTDIFVDPTNVGQSTYSNRPYIRCPECNETIYLNEDELWKK